MITIPRVIQVIPTDDYKVYVYFDDWSIRLYDAKPLLDKGLFQQLKDINKFKNCCTVLNNTLSWDLNGDFDTTKCIDVDALMIHKSSPIVNDPMEILSQKEDNEVEQLTDEIFKRYDKVFRELAK